MRPRRGFVVERRLRRRRLRQRAERRRRVAAPYERRDAEPGVDVRGAGSRCAQCSDRRLRGCGGRCGERVDPREDARFEREREQGGHRQQGAATGEGAKGHVGVRGPGLRAQRERGRGDSVFEPDA